MQWKKTHLSWLYIYRYPSASIVGSKYALKRPSTVIGINMKLPFIFIPITLGLGNKNIDFVAVHLSFAN